MPPQVFTFDAALDVVERQLRCGASYSVIEDWIDAQYLDEEDKAVLWFVLHGNKGRRVIRTSSYHQPEYSGLN